VTEWISAGALPVVRLGPSGRLARVRQVDLEAFIDRGLSGSVPARERAGEEADSEPPVA
jgi:hypothetical protein